MRLPYERGVLSNSALYESTPSQRAENTLYYLQRAGHFYCNTSYFVKRESLPSFLLAIVLKGELEVCAAQKNVVVRAGNIALINCYLPHSYRARTVLEYVWLHFDGANTSAFYEEFFKENESILCMMEHCRVEDRVLSIIEQLKQMGNMEETAVSRKLHDILCDLLYGVSEQSIESPMIAKAQQYINKNLRESIAVHEIAKYCCVSPSHFTRLFRKYTGQSPHEYCMNLRIHKAKQLLKETEMSIAEISDAIGYEYDSSFTSAFRKKVGLSPRSFRNMPI